MQDDEVPFPTIDSEVPLPKRTYWTARSRRAAMLRLAENMQRGDSAAVDRRNDVHVLRRALNARGIATVVRPILGSDAAAVGWRVWHAGPMRKTRQ
jgi:hypothetical protein